MDMKFYKCSHCGNIVAYVQDNGPKIVCCGEEMKEMVANTTDAATEKHVPVVTVDGSPVRSPPSPSPWPPATSSWPPMSTATSTACGRRHNLV